MNISLNGIAIKDFKGIKEQTIEFNGKNAQIYADNAVGKTTVYDAFLWNLFGKDSKGKADFEIVPLIDGQPNRGVEPSVTLDLSVDGESLVLKRTLKSKWLNRRGALERTFDGYTTEFIINEVPVKQNEYKAKIDSIVSEQTFRNITNVDAFLTMNKKDQRAYLLNMIDGIDPVEMCQGDADLLRVVATMQAKGHTTDDLLKIVTSKIKEHKKEQDQIPARIDELKRRNEPVENNEKLGLQIEALEKEIELAQPGMYETVSANYMMLDKACNDIRAHMEELKKEHAELEVMSGEGVVSKCPTCHQVIEDKANFIAQRKQDLIKNAAQLKATYQGLDKQRQIARENLDACKKPEVIAEQKRFLDELKTKLALANLASDTSNRIHELEQRNRELATLIVQQEGIKNAVERFIRAKAEAVQSGVNDLFSTLKFRLFDEAMNGNISDDCTAMVNGNVPYSDCSRSEAIRAGQEVINAIQRYSNTRAVVFIDNAESASWLNKMDCQMITLYVKEEEKELKVVVE